MAIPLIVGGALAAGSFLMGKSGGGGAGMLSGNEFFTDKEYTSEQNTYTDSRTWVNNSQKAIDLQFNYALGDKSKITTKKEQSMAQTPTVAPVVNVIPTTAQGSTFGGAGSSGGGINMYDIAIIGGLGYAAYYFLTKDDK